MAAAVAALAALMAAVAFVFASPARLMATPARIAAAPPAPIAATSRAVLPPPPQHAPPLLLSAVLGLMNDRLPLADVLRGAMIIHLQRAFLGGNDHGAIQHGDFAKGLKAPGRSNWKSRPPSRAREFPRWGGAWKHCPWLSKTVTSFGVP